MCYCFYLTPPYSRRKRSGGGDSETREVVKCQDEMYNSRDEAHNKTCKINFKKFPQRINYCQLILLNVYTISRHEEGQTNTGRKYSMPSGKVQQGNDL